MSHKSFASVAMIDFVLISFYLTVKSKTAYPYVF